MVGPGRFKKSWGLSSFMPIFTGNVSLYSMRMQNRRRKVVKWGGFTFV